MKQIDPIKEFYAQRAPRIDSLGSHAEFKKLSIEWLEMSMSLGYVYNFDVLGRPIIQTPNDVVAIQELIWEVKPDLIIETGIAHGGSLVLSASMLALIDYCDAVQAGKAIDPRHTTRRVLGIDIDIREHNRAAILAHPMSHRIDMLQGSSINETVIEQVWNYAKPFTKVMVFLDSNHTHEHVLSELRAYAPLTTKNSYCVVFDTFVEDLPKGFYKDRPWDVGNNPKTAVYAYLNELNSQSPKAADGEALAFKIDKNIDNKIAISVAPDGYLKRI